MPASQADLKRLERDTYDAVRANPFKTIVGKVTWDDVEAFEEEARDIAMKFQPSYGFTEEYGLCYLVMPEDEYLAETGVEAEFQYPEKPDLMPDAFEDLDDDQLKIADRELDERNKDYAMHQGFTDAFGENYREAFPEKYCQQLKQGRVKKYKFLKPMDYILHLREKVPLDTTTIKRLRANFYRGWQEEDLEGYRTRLEEERDNLGRLSTPITITDEDLLQHYLEEMWKRTDIFDKPIMTEFLALDPEDRDWETAPAFFEKKMKQAEDYIANGGQDAKFADANAVEDLEERHRQQMAEQKRELQQEHANAISEMEQRTQAKIDKLAEVVLALAEAKKKKKHRRNRRQSVSESDDSSSEEEEERTPPRPKRKKQRQQRQQTQQNKNRGKENRRGIPASRGKVYVPGEPFERGMVPKQNPTSAWMRCYNAARGNFMQEGGPAGIEERLAGYRRLKAKAAAGRDMGRAFSEEKLDANVAKYEAELVLAKTAEKAAGAGE